MVFRFHLLYHRHTELHTVGGVCVCVWYNSVQTRDFLEFAVKGISGHEI